MLQPLKVISHDIRNQIKLYRKKQNDIAELIRNVEITNEDLSYSYISDLNLVGRNISNVNFTGVKMKIQFQKGTARNCTFISTTFLPGSSLRGADMRTCNFNNAYAPNIDFAYVDFRQCDICNVTFTMFSKKMYKVKFDKNFLKLFSRFVEIEGFDLNAYL